MVRIEILKCVSGGQKLVTFHRTNDRAEALQRALRLNFGKRAQFVRDHGLGGDGVMYGQIGVPVRGQPHVLNMVTGRVRIEGGAL